MEFLFWIPIWILAGFLGWRAGDIHQKYIKDTINKTIKIDNLTKKIKKINDKTSVPSNSDYTWYWAGSGNSKFVVVQINDTEYVEKNQYLKALDAFFELSSKKNKC